jgi:FtsP/CotA-like multicopper oxidase with cupredoxin domain
VVNRLAEPTAIHWHGIELESYFDGVVGVGGLQSTPSPTIMPGDSFEVRMTPPRAGSFMYHTHVNDIRQLRGGLWGPLLVVEPETPRDPARDLVFITGEGTDFSALLNGSAPHQPRELVAGASYRIRLMNVTAGTPNLQYWLVTDSTTILWTPVARDGFDLPPWQRAARRAEESVSIGQTADFEFLAPRSGALALEARTGVGDLLARQPFSIRKP